MAPVSFSDVDGWGEDRQNETLAAFAKSCERILKSSPDKDLGLAGKAADWQSVCRAMPLSEVVTPENARQFFEQYFTPYQASDAGKADGLFTGYYEASLRGSSVREGDYQTPLRARPDDLVMVNLGEFRPELKGQRIAGRVKNGQLKPYEDRAAIELGKLPKAEDRPLYWVDSAVDAFFLQVQGSGVVSFPDGTAQRIGYDGQNGHPYTAIGKELIARGALTKENVSMQSIREWLAAHPDEAADVMRINASYVFFKKLDTDAPIGAEGIPLTPERSIAVDHSIWPYGIPMFIAADHPDGSSAPLHRLMVAQDTGGAITGVVRGDFFWGYGDKAAQNAGLMKSRGQLWVLLPKSVVPQSIQ
jgi:membrane-bound lytic murein transglycosylase A